MAAARLASVVPLLGLLAPLCTMITSAQLLPFPCGSHPPCEDDKTFLVLDIFPCDDPGMNICEFPSAVSLCQSTCASCPICQDLEVPAPFDAVIQTREVKPGVVSIWMDSDKAIGGLQGSIVCLVGGVPFPLDVAPDLSIGLAYQSAQFSLSAGIQGKFLGVSYTGGIVSPGYNQVFSALPLTDSGSIYSSCDPGSIGVSGILAIDQQGNSLSVCGGVDAPCQGMALPSTPPPSSHPCGSVAAVVLSDPHFVGLQGQVFDVSGEADGIYSLVADDPLFVNARFSTAYTTGIHMDSESRKVEQTRAQGTWISEIGIVIGLLTLQVSVEPASKVEECHAKPDDCIRDGSVVVDGRELIFVGTIKTASNVTVQVVNKKSSSAVVLGSRALAMQIDIVPPPQAWHVAGSEYFHLNLHFHKIDLSENASGIVGDSSRVKYDADGRPIMSAFDKNGTGILDHTIDMYQVDSLLFTMG